jgi:hypothetical protein
MKALFVAVLALAATACAASAPAPVVHTNPNLAADREIGATNRQASEQANRAMTKDECNELGEYIAGVCHDTNSRQARIEGWCSDMTARATSGTFADDCVKHLTYMDSVCYRSTDNAPSMMMCDRNAGQ